MSNVSKYCKAYQLKTLRQFNGWAEKIGYVRKRERCSEYGIPVEVETDRILTGEDYLYLQDNYVVTDSIVKDKYVIFDDVTPEWVGFCRQTLKFEVPAFVCGKSLDKTTQGSSGDVDGTD